MTGEGSPALIRLYPAPFCALESDQQFAKYQPVRVRVETHGGDRRPETRRPDRDSIELLGPALPTTHEWESRRRFVEPLMVGSMCEVLRRQREDATSLGVFRPKCVSDIIFDPPTSNRRRPPSHEPGLRRARSWTDWLRARRNLTRSPSLSRSLGPSSTSTNATSRAARHTPSRSSIGKSLPSTATSATTPTGGSASRPVGSATSAIPAGTRPFSSATCTSTSIPSSCWVSGGRRADRIS